VLNKVRQFTEMQCINRQCRLTVNLGTEPLWVLSDDRWLLQALISLVESALAAGSTAIALELSGVDNSTVTLQFTCNAATNQWPPSPPDDLSEANPKPSLSHSFRYHLARRLLGHLGSAIHPAVSATDDQHCLTIQLPIAGEGHDA
jgi:hypothetical protein